MPVWVLGSASARPGVRVRECDSWCLVTRVRVRVLMNASASPGVNERECESGC